MVRSGQVKSSQVRSSQVKSSQVKSSLVWSGLVWSGSFFEISARPLVLARSAQQVSELVTWPKRSKLVLRWPGIEPGSTAWKAAMLTTIPPSLVMLFRAGACSAGRVFPVARFS